MEVTPERSAGMGTAAADVALTVPLLVSALEAEDPAMVRRLLARASAETRQSPLGTLYLATERQLDGHHEEAEDLLRQCEPHLEGIARTIALVNRAISAANRLTPDVQPYVQQLAEAAHPDWEWLTGTRHRINGDLALLAGDFALAQVHWEAAATSYEAAGCANPLMRIRGALSALLINSGNFAAADSQIRLMFEEARRATIPPRHALYDMQALVALWRMRPDDAKHWYDRGVALFADTGQAFEEARLRARRVYVQLVLGDRAGAEADIQSVGTQLTDGGRTIHVIEYWQTMATFHLYRRDLSAANEALIEAEKRLQDHQSFQRSILDNLHAILASLQGDWARVRRIAAARAPELDDMPAAQVLFLDLHALADERLGDQAASDGSRQALADRCRQLGIDVAYVRRLNLLAADVDTRPAIRCFGGIEVLDAQGLPLLSPKNGSRLREALAVLIIEPDGLTADELSDRLGLNHTSDKGAAMIISRLRRVLVAAGLADGGNAVPVRQGRYQLAASVRKACAFDTFEGVWRAAGSMADPTEAYRRLLDLYEGPLMAGLENGNWLTLAQQSSFERWLTAALWLGRRALASDEPAAALAVAEQTLPRDPWAMPLHRLKLEALLRLGQDGEETARRHWQVLQTWYGDQPGDAALDALTAWWRDASSEQR